VILQKWELVASSTAFLLFKLFHCTNNDCNIVFFFVCLLQLPYFFVFFQLHGNLFFAFRFFMVLINDLCVLLS